MQWKMSNKLYEAWAKRRVRVTSQTPKRLAYLWMNMIKPKLWEVESVYEIPTSSIISKRRYGMEAEGSPETRIIRAKSLAYRQKPLARRGYKPCSSAEGATCEKMARQIHKTCHPELGCSGNLNSSETVHLVNVGTSHFGRETGLAATDVRCEGRNSRSSLRYGKHITWQRTVASCESERK
jgi:hypothetical protein